MCNCEQLLSCQLCMLWASPVWQPPAKTRKTRENKRESLPRGPVRYAAALVRSPIYLAVCVREPGSILASKANRNRFQPRFCSFLRFSRASLLSRSSFRYAEHMAESIVESLLRAVNSCCSDDRDVPITWLFWISRSPSCFFVSFVVKGF